MLPLFDCRQHAVGVIAIGQVATGFLAIGQVATGVIAVGQLARGVVAVGQLSVGVVTVGMLTAGLGRAVGLLAVGASAGGLLKLRLVPPRADNALPPTVPLDAVRAGTIANGWVRLSVRRGGSGRMEWFLGRERVPVELESPGAVHGGRLEPGDVLALLHRSERFEPEAATGFRSAAPHGHGLVATAVQPLPAQYSRSALAWAARVAALLALAALVWFVALAPLVDLALASFEAKG